MSDTSDTYFLVTMCINKDPAAEEKKRAFLMFPMLFPESEKVRILDALDEGIGLKNVLNPTFIKVTSPREVMDEFERFLLSVNTNPEFLEQQKEFLMSSLIGVMQASKEVTHKAQIARLTGIEMDLLKTMKATLAEVFGEDVFTAGEDVFTNGNTKSVFKYDNFSAN